MLARDRLLRILVRNIIRLRREHRDELHTAFYEQVSSLFGESHGCAAFCGAGDGGRVEDFGYDLLDGRCEFALSCCLLNIVGYVEVACDAPAMAGVERHGILEAGRWDVKLE